MNKWTSHAQATAMSLVLTVLLIAAQGMEARAQALTVERFGENGVRTDVTQFRGLIEDETPRFTIGDGEFKDRGYGSSEMLLLQDGESIRAVSASSQVLENVVLMVVWIPTEDCVRDFINHYPNNLGQTLPNLKYVYVQGELAANDAQAIQAKRGTSGNLLILCDQIVSNTLEAAATEQ